MKRALALLVALLVAALASPSMAAMGFSNVRDPRTNVPAIPAYTNECWVHGSATATCRAQALAAVNRARALEHVRPMVLPRGFWTLSGTKQIFIVTDLERVARGLPPFIGLTSQLDSWALSASRRNQDPSVASWQLANGVAAHNDGSIWAADYNILDADYGWMYDDGWAGAGNFTRNLACPTPNAYGCWGHREIILGRYTGGSLLLAGTGSVPNNYAHIFRSDSELFVAATGKVPPLAYTWKQAVAAGAH